MNKRVLIIALVTIAVLASGYFFLGEQGTQEENNEVITEVVRGELQVEVTTTGELQAKNAVNILGPTGLRMARIWQVKIDDIVDEGTVVKKDDFIAALDRSELDEKIREEELELEESKNTYEQTKIDTAIALQEVRDKLVNLKYDVQEKKLVLEQSQYEPPATIKQAELALKKAERALVQAEQEYQLLSEKSMSQMRQANARLKDDQADLDFLVNLSREFVIKAPENGMVIYARDWNGSKKGKGSQVQSYFPEVATLPDLSSMVSKTYVNEVDISKIIKGQQVKIGLDAFPEKKLTGEVTSIANVGEQRPNSDAKVFEVTVEVNESDTTLRPAMTTSNAIITDYVENVLLIPLESLHSQGDTLTYIFHKKGLSVVKQEVELGKKGNDMAVVLRGVEEGDAIFLSVPNEPESKPLVLLEETDEPLAGNQ